MPKGFDLPDDVGLLIGNRIHRTKVSARGVAVGGNVNASQVVGEQIIHGDSHVSFGAPPAAEARPRPAAPVLTPGEQAVAKRLGEDVSPATMAKALGCSVATVRSHIQAIQSKLGVRSRHAAVAALVRVGMC